jgi:hypothetical protein
VRRRRGAFAFGPVRAGRWGEISSRSVVVVGNGKFWKWIRRPRIRHTHIVSVLAIEGLSTSETQTGMNFSGGDIILHDTQESHSWYVGTFVNFMVQGTMWYLPGGTWFNPNVGNWGLKGTQCLNFPQCS